MKEKKQLRRITALLLILIMTVSGVKETVTAGTQEEFDDSVAETALETMEFYNGSGELLTNTADEPAYIVYGETMEIYLKKEPDVTYSVLPGQYVGIDETIVFDTSTNADYDIAMLKAVGYAETGDTVTFTKTGEHEMVSMDFHVKTQKRMLSIQPEEEISEPQIIYTKVYDGENKVSANTETGDSILFRSMSLEEGLLEGDEVWVDLENIPHDFYGEMPDPYPVDTAAEEQAWIMFEQSQLYLKGADAENYELENKSIKVPAQVTILPRPVEIMVSNGQREYGHGSEYKFTSGFEDGQWILIEGVNWETNRVNQGILKKDKFDIPTADDRERIEQWIEEKQSDEYGGYGNLTVPGTYAQALGVKTSGFWGNDTAKNYVFTINHGQLVILPEHIPDNDIEDYLDFSEYAEHTGMYVEEGEHKKVWVKANGGKLNLYAFSKKLYDRVLLLGISEEQSDLSQPVDLTEQGYVFQENICGTAERKLILQFINSGNGAESEKFQYTVYLDGNTPSVSIKNIRGEVRDADKLVSGITFGTFGKTVIKADVSIEDTSPDSGLHHWKYKILSLDRDIKNGKELRDYITALKEGGKFQWDRTYYADTRKAEIEIVKSGKQDMGKISDNYIVLVKPYDHVGNSKIYTSMGVVLDDTEPEVILEIAEEYRQVYDHSVNLKAIVSDVRTSPEDSVSEIQKVFYQTAAGRENLDHGEKIYLFDLEKQEPETTFTLEELQNPRTLVLTEDMEGNPFQADKKWNSNDIWVRVTALDHSQNSFTAEIRLRIDTAKPEVRVTYSTEAGEDYAPYYKKSRSAVVEIKERNIQPYNMEQLYILLKREKDSSAVKYGLDSLNCIDGVTAELVKDSQAGKEDWEFTDERTVDIRIDFHGEDRYEFDIQCMDMGGLKNQEDNASCFIIDKTPPKLQVSYYADEKETKMPDVEAKRTYHNKHVKAKINIEEHNFALKGRMPSIEMQITEERKIKSLKEWNENADMHTGFYVFDKDEDYVHSIIYTDLAGNTAYYDPVYFTVDRTPPEGKVSIKGFGFWEKLLEKITFGLFSPSEVQVVITGKDATSPLKSIRYAEFSYEAAREELENYENWQQVSFGNKGYAEITVKADRQFVVYAEIMDYAGNYIFVSSDGMIIDSTKPSLGIHVTNLSRSHNGIYKDDVILQIEAEDPVAGDTYAGLKKVWYTVLTEGNVSASESTELLNYTDSQQAKIPFFSKEIVIPAETYNSNQVKVQAFAVDFSGNQSQSEVLELKIDITKPELSVSWDSNKPVHDRYYNEIRRASVTVRDRNFHADHVRFYITNTDGAEAHVSEWTYSGNMGISDKETNTCQVTFSEDGDYTFRIECTDLAGNDSSYIYEERFTIDRTKPVISVVYDHNSPENEKYFKNRRTAVVKIQEHNFREEDVRLTITASLRGGEIARPLISPFSHESDWHTAEIQYYADGEYTFHIQYTDLAGNIGNDYVQDSFIIDTTPPEIEITNIMHQSANNGVVAPNIKVTDINYDKNRVNIAVTAANRGKVNIEKTVYHLENGERTELEDFPREENMDDLYELKVEAIDKAGNISTQSIEFSVNRFGSVYILDEDTRRWLSTGDGEYTYISREREIGIIEYNIDEIQASTITLGRDGELMVLEENENYTVTGSMDETGWKTRHYSIYAGNFTEEGNYAVILNTLDKARNRMNNTSFKKGGGSIPVEFAVDKTPPSLVVSGIKNRGRYRADEKRMVIDVKDNLALKKLAVKVNGEESVFESDELREKNGIIEMTLWGSDKWQTVEISAEDAAGNLTGQTGSDKKGKTFILKVLVTPDIVIQYYRNTPLFLGTLTVVFLLLGSAVWFLFRKRFNTAEK